MTDHDIVKNILGGDKTAFSELLEIYQRQILAYCARLLSFHQEDAQDATSETFLKVYINLASYNLNLKFSSWIYRIAHNESVNIIAKKSKIYIKPLDDQLDILFTEIDFDKPRKEDIEKILSQLSVDDRNLLILFYLEEKSLREIGEILKISDNNVAVKLNRARTKAKKLVK